MSDEMNRRAFLAAAAAATCACALCPMAHAADDDEDSDEPPPQALPKGPSAAGNLSDYAKDGAYDSLNKSKQIILVRENGKLYALSAICTHKEFIIKTKEGQLFCPKHSSRFDLDGKPAKKPNGKMGPAKKPLLHYAISADAAGAITVDTSKVVAESDPTASIKAGG